MAQYSEANSKTQAAAIATALTLIWGDTVDTRANSLLVDPTHPMRQLEKMLSFDPATGIVTSDDVYITGAYDGKTIVKGNAFSGVVAKPTAALSTATVENGDKDGIILTYDMQLEAENQPAITDFTIVDDAVGVTAISTVVISTDVITITMDGDYANGDVITASYTPGAHPVKCPNGNDCLALVTESVTNNVA